MKWQPLLVLVAVGCSHEHEHADARAPEHEPDHEHVQVQEHVQEQAKADTGTAVLTGVRIAPHDMYDRIVFELDGNLPAHEVKWATGPVFQCGSGEEVPLPGDAALMVKLSPANGHTESGEATSPKEVAGVKAANVLLAKRICDFEADVQYAIAVRKRTDFRENQLTGPTRLVVDVRAGL